jgi:hypothetical protein
MIAFPQRAAQLKLLMKKQRHRPLYGFTATVSFD